MSSWAAVGLSREPAPSPGSSAALVAALASGDPAPAPFVVRRLAPVPAVSGERPITADQTNVSVVVGERLVVKWLLRPERRPPVLTHLASVGFAATARPYATVSAPVGDADVLLALVVDYLPDATDGYGWCVDAALAGREVGGVLGALVGGLHTAFATPSEVFPSPRGEAGPAEIAGWAARAEAAVDEAVAAIGTADVGDPLPADTPNDGPTADPAVGLREDRRWLSEHAARLRAAVGALRRVEAPSPVQPIHGDLHVGQVLRWRDGYAVVDFDGNPTVPRSGAATPEPVARDVAQMLCSIDHVGRIADRRTAGARGDELAAWIRAARAGFLTAYRATPAGDTLDDRLLAAFEVEQECRELIYAARFLPRWRYAPMATLRAMFPRSPSD
ncbi:hypothetical protein [Cryptosporangium japonicum]|uniref:Glucosamine kinase n=1 Tax=Cryptosporangium japonicum TaxID=80872 RepID=A0ABN0V9J6_9ACTN